MASKTTNVTATIQPEAKAQAEAVPEAIDGMNKEQFDTLMEKGYSEAKSGIGLSVDEAFNKIREKNK